MARRSPVLASLVGRVGSWRSFASVECHLRWLNPAGSLPPSPEASRVQLATPGLARTPVDYLAGDGADVLERGRQCGELLQGAHRAVGAAGVDTLVEFQADEGGGDCPGETAEVHEVGERAVSQDPVKHRLDLGDPQAEPGGGRRTEPRAGLCTGQHLGEDGKVAGRALVRVQRPAEVQQFAQGSDRAETVSVSGDVLLRAVPHRSAEQLVHTAEVVEHERMVHACGGGDRPRRGAGDSPGAQGLERTLEQPGPGIAVHQRPFVCALAAAPRAAAAAGRAQPLHCVLSRQHAVTTPGWARTNVRRRCLCRSGRPGASTASWRSLVHVDTLTLVNPALSIESLRLFSRAEFRSTGADSFTIMMSLAAKTWWRNARPNPASTLDATSHAAMRAAALARGRRAARPAAATTTTAEGKNRKRPRNTPRIDIGTKSAAMIRHRMTKARLVTARSGTATSIAHIR